MVYNVVIFKEILSHVVNVFTLTSICNCLLLKGLLVCLVICEGFLVHGHWSLSPSKFISAPTRDTYDAVTQYQKLQTKVV